MSNHVSAAATGLPVAYIAEIHDYISLALDATERRDGYNVTERECRSYLRSARRRTAQLLGSRA